jgi:hypothetical protein
MRRILVALVVAALAAGCGGGEEAPAPLSAQDLEVAIGRACEPRAEDRLGDERTAFAAVVAGDRAAAYARPGGKRIRVFGHLNVNRVRTVFGVLAVRWDKRCDPAWYRVRLPIRPNGATGYVRAEVVDVFTVATRIEVDLSKRRIVLFRDGRRVITTTTAIGSPVTPTPTGRYYVNQRLYPQDPNGPFGPGAVGISSFSPVLTGWAQGGPIAIHGTNRPWSIGKAVTNGCLRIPNKVLARLFDQAWAGTPVIVRA